MANQSQTVTFSIDSNDRFDDNFRECPFWKLPHDENGWNHLLGTNKNGTLYWRDKEVLNLKNIPGFEEDKTFYSKFITSDDSGENYLWVRPPLNFDGIEITNAWVAIFLDSEDQIPHDDISPIDDETKTSCAITGTITISSDTTKDQLLSDDDE